MAGVLEHADDAWREFRAAARAVPEARLVEPRPGQWTRLEMLVHIAAWHDVTARRLRGFRETGQPVSWDEDDETFNARVARESAGRSVTEVLDELDASYERLRAQIATLHDERMAAHDGWPVERVAGNTWDHYAEHAPELDRG